MSVDFALPVKSLIKNWSRGSKLAKKFGKSASTASAEDALEISESVEKLQRSLERHSEAVATVYKRCLDLCGEPFAKALIEDNSVQSQLTKLRADLMDQVNEIQDVEPEDFDADIFTGVQTESDNISKECIKVFEAVRDALAKANLESFPEERDDRAGLTSMRVRGNSTSTESSFSTTAAPLRIITPALEMDSGPPLKPHISWTIESPSTNDRISNSRRTSSRPLSEEIPISTNPDDFIPTELVEVRWKANLDFLERRQQERVAFQSEFRKSVISIEEDRESSFSDIASPISPIVASPIEARPMDGRTSRTSSNDYPAFVNGQRGHFHASDRKRTSTASSQFTTGTIPGDRQSMSSHHKPTEEDLFGQQTPGIEAGSSRDSVALAATLKMPGYGDGVEDGLEAVAPVMVDYDNEKIFIPSSHSNDRTTPTASMKSIDSPMRHDTSFYKFGGFCEGGMAAMRGELGYKVARRPTGTYGSQDFARCIKCSYEVTMSQVEKDVKRDSAGIYGNSGIRWRQQFLTKCHVKTSAAEDPLYACVFCIEDRKTPEEHDATVFFSHKQLFQHLARHPRPLTRVAGVNALYGQIDPNITDFDLHFIKNEATPSRYNLTEIAPLVAVRPSANAITTYHPKNSRTNSKDPDGNPALHFAAGARILGIAFPENFGGAWCTGYHDGEKGSLPSAAITLDLPSNEDIHMNPQSSLVAFAKWEFKPRDAKEGGWLKFSRGDKISHIGYTFYDQWCWSGQTKNGKWGLFPMAFVEGLRDGGTSMGSPVSVKSGLMGLRKFGSMSSSFPISRSGKSGRSASVRSGSSGNVPSVKPQPGLEVVVNGVVM